MDNVFQLIDASLQLIEAKQKTPFPPVLSFLLYFFGFEIVSICICNLADIERERVFSKSISSYNK